MMSFFDPRLGQDFKVSVAIGTFSSLTHNFFVLDGIFDPGTKDLKLLDLCISHTSKLGFFVVTPWIPGSSQLRQKLEQDFSVASEFEGSLCGYFNIATNSVEKLIEVRNAFGGKQSGEWGIGGCTERFCLPTRQKLSRGELWNLFHILNQPTKLGCLLYFGEMQQTTLLTRVFDGLDSALKTVELKP
jgi:hypothetical protein